MFQIPSKKGIIALKTMMEYGGVKVQLPSFLMLDVISFTLQLFDMLGKRP
jgi:hypothetical protein